jgi:hypothetical protein
MNTLQTTLTALQSQLESQKEASKYYYENVFTKEIATLEASIVEWFYKFTGETYTIKIESGGETLQIYSIDQEKADMWRHNAITINYYSRYNEEAKAKLSFYSKECEYDDTKTIAYLKTLGMVAVLLNQINFMMPTWKAEYQQYAQKRYATFEQPISHTEFAIRKTEAEILEEGLASYKQAGFTHTISSRTECERHYNVDYQLEGAYTLEIKPNQYFDLQTGRGRYDNVRVYAFEVVGHVKNGKVEMNIKTTAVEDGSFSPIVVTKARFDDFIATVYNWENFDRAKYNAKQTERYLDHMSKFTTVVEVA